MARLGPPVMSAFAPLPGVERTSASGRPRTGFDPLQSSAVQFSYIVTQVIRSPRRLGPGYRFNELFCFLQVLHRIPDSRKPCSGKCGRGFPPVLESLSPTKSFSQELPPPRWLHTCRDVDDPDRIARD